MLDNSKGYICFGGNHTFFEIQPRDSWKSRSFDKVPSLYIQYFTIFSPTPVEKLKVRAIDKKKCSRGQVCMKILGSLMFGLLRFSQILTHCYVSYNLFMLVGNYVPFWN